MRSRRPAIPSDDPKLISLTLPSMRSGFAPTVFARFFPPLFSRSLTTRPDEVNFTRRSLENPSPHSALFLVSMVSSFLPRTPAMSLPRDLAPYRSAPCPPPGDHQPPELTSVHGVRADAEISHVEDHPPILDIEAAEGMSSLSHFPAGRRCLFEAIPS